MNNLLDIIKSINSFDDAKDLVVKNKDFIKKAALPVLVVAALLFFWVTGGEKNEIIEENTDGSNIEASDDYENEMDNDTNGSKKNTASEIYVDISGCVNKSGVYCIPQGTRLFQLIEKAGGLREDANVDIINRAEEVYDGQKIIIYSVNDQFSEDYNPATSSGNSSSSSSSNKININKANSSELQKIPGIGPKAAEKIIEYRENNGRFFTIEDLKNISGIGEKTFEKMKSHITV
jgi:competence protein ComEA